MRRSLPYTFYLAGLVQLARGPDFVGEAYGEVLDRFTTIARREKAVYLSEVWGPSDLEQKLSQWQGLWDAYRQRNSGRP